VISSQRSIDGWKKQWHIWLDRFTSNYCDVIIANSESAKNILVSREGIQPEKIKVVYNAVKHNTASRSRASDNCNFTVGYVGRLHNEKGAYLLPAIIRETVRKNPKFKFRIIGDGPERINIIKKINDYKLGNNVVFTGWKTIPEEIYPSFDILLLPSAEESFPQAVLEAFSFGVPAVAADVGGVGELVDDGKSGIIVKSKKPQDFAAAIIKIADNGYSYNQFCENARIKSLDFTLEKMIGSIDDIYTEILAQKS